MPFEIVVSPPDQPIARLLLAHGAGAPADSDFMNVISDHLVASGIEVVRFEFDYMAGRREGRSKRPPPREPVLREEWQQQVSRWRADAPDNLPLFIGGKSMGGRMASLVADELAPAGLICLGYPFHPIGKPDVLRTAHLAALKTPALIVQGTRDAFGTREEVSGYSLSSAIRLHWLGDGDHDFKARIASGFTWHQHMQSAAVCIHQFIQSQAGTR